MPYACLAHHMSQWAPCLPHATYGPHAHHLMGFCLWRAVDPAQFDIPRITEEDVQREDTLLLTCPCRVSIEKVTMLMI